MLYKIDNHKTHVYYRCQESRCKQLFDNWYSAHPGYELVVIPKSVPKFLRWPLLMIHQVFCTEQDHWPSW
jgi:hypothetical protein